MDINTSAGFLPLTCRLMFSFFHVPFAPSFEKPNGPFDGHLPALSSSGWHAFWFYSPGPESSWLFLGFVAQHLLALAGGRQSGPSSYQQGALFRLQYTRQTKDCQGKVGKNDAHWFRLLFSEKVCPLYLYPFNLWICLSLRAPFQVYAPGATCNCSWWGANHWEPGLKPP